MAFLINLYVSFALSWAVGRLGAKDGPRLKNLEGASGEYGVPMARGYGSRVRLAGAFMAQADIDEDKHKLGGNQTLIGAGIGLGAGLIGAAVGGLLGAATQTYYYTYSCTFALFLLDRTNDDPIENVLKLWANGKKIFDSSSATIKSETLDADGKLIRRKYGKNKFFKSLTIYGGHEDQDVDPILAGQQEINETSGYIYSAYIVIEDLELEPFGNSVPPAEALIQVKTNETFASAAESISAAAGIDRLREISTTALTGDILRGYWITSETSCWDALKPLLPVFGADAAEVSGQIRFYKRNQFMRSTMTADDLGAHAYGSEPPTSFTFRRTADFDLPKETSVTFVDPDRNYQANSATSERIEGDAASNIAVTLQMVLTADEGASAAALMHWDAWLGRTSLSFALTDAWNSLAVGYAYGIPFAGQIVPYRITRRVRGANGIIEVEAISDESVTYRASVAGSSGTIPDENGTEIEETRLVLMDMPITSDDHDDYGFYIAMAGDGPEWDRGAIQISADGVEFETIVDQPFGAVMGDVSGTLAAGTTTGLDDTLDTTSVLLVTLLHDGMELESATDTELDNWANFAFVGKDGLGEYLQFKTATFVSGTTWQLTNLRRGRRGTDHAIGTHASGEEFVLLGDEGVIRFVQTTIDEWGNDFTFRGLTFGQDDDDIIDTQTFTNTGEGKRPFSPVNVDGTWDGSNNLTITWDSRSRLFAGGLGIDDNFEFDIEIISGTGRSDTVTVETFVYSAANQITDGITPGDSIQGRVRQTSDVNDGRWRDFLLLGPDDTWELEDDLTPIHLEDGTTPLGLEA